MKILLLVLALIFFILCGIVPSPFLILPSGRGIHLPLKTICWLTGIIILICTPKETAKDKLKKEVDDMDIFKN